MWDFANTSSSNYSLLLASADASARGQCAAGSGGVYCASCLHGYYRTSGGNCMQVGKRPTDLRAPPCSMLHDSAVELS